MKYVLVDKGDNIVDRVELGSNVGISGAKTYFKGVKRMPKDEDFDMLWKVMTERQYDNQFTVSQRQNKQYEWWKEDKHITDEELKI